MNTTLKKTFGDLRSNPGRAALIVFALVIGLWGVGSIVVSYAILKNDLNENFIRTHPAHVVVTADNLDRLDLAAFRKRADIESAEYRDLSIQRIEVFPDRWIPLWLFAVEDFNDPHVARIYHEKGSKVPDPGSMLIERNGQFVSNLEVGSRPRVRVAGRMLTVPVTGISFDPAQAPATQDAFIYAYVDKKTYTAITGEPANRRLILRLKNIDDTADARAAARVILDDFKRLGVDIKTVDVPKLNEHPHQWQLNTLIVAQGGIGLLAFVMGAILVSQLMASILVRETRQIGILKAIGASRWKVLAIYLMMALLFGAASSAIAIPLAVVSGYGFARFVSKILNFEVLTTRLPAAVYLSLVASGLLLPLLFSLRALLKGVSVSVQEALSDYGIRQDAYVNSAALFARLPLPLSLQLAFRNTMRRKGRLAITVATMALGVAIFSTGFNVRQSLVEFLARTSDSMKHDVQVVFKEQISLQKALAPFKSTDNVSRVEAWNGGRGRLQTGVISAANGIGIVALPYDTDLIQWDVLRGRWLRNAHEAEIVMNQRAAEAYGNPAVGKSYPIDLGAATITAKLVGIVREFEVAKIYIDKNRYDDLVNPGHLVNSLMFVAADKNPDKLVRLRVDIEKAIAPSDLSVLYIMSKMERAKIIYDHLNIILTMFTLLSVLVLAVGALGMASATSISVMERTREIGVLRAIGATPQMIYGLFVAEGMMVSAASILLGLIASWPLSAAASSLFGSLILGPTVPLEYAFSALGLAVTSVIVLTFGWLASRIPARKVVAISTREALAYE